MSQHDIAAHYRLHAQEIADGERRRPIRAVLLEFDAQGTPHLYRFGAPDMAARESLGLYLDAAAVLLNAATLSNADASN